VVQTDNSDSRENFHPHLHQHQESIAYPVRGYNAPGHNRMYCHHTVPLLPLCHSHMQIGILYRIHRYSMERIHHWSWTGILTLRKTDQNINRTYCTKYCIDSCRTSMDIRRQLLRTTQRRNNRNELSSSYVKEWATLL
jgi:hypothetical protein